MSKTFFHRLKMKKICAFSTAVVLLVSLTAVSVFAETSSGTAASGASSASVALSASETSAASGASAVSGAAAASETTTSSAVSAADPSVVSTNGIPGWPGAADIISTAGCLMDADTGTILYNKSMDAQMYPASVTKIMTCLLALEKGNLSDQVTMTSTGTAYVASGSSNLSTKVGEVFTLEQLLYGTMLKSANDMATQVGEYIGGGSLDNFIQMMNDRAASLGCTNTHFSNACGMPDNTHYTSAHDLALIAQAALKIDEFRTIVGTGQYTIPATNMSAARTITSHNPLLVSPDYIYPGIIGGKTGNTNAAESTLAEFAERNGMTLIAITLHAADGSYVAKDCTDLLNYGFNSFKDVTVGKADYTYSGGVVTIPASADISACTVSEQAAPDTDQGAMVNEVYTFGGQTVGNLLMTKANAEKYKKELEKEKTASKAAESQKTDSAKAADSEASSKADSTSSVSAQTASGTVQDSQSAASSAREGSGQHLSGSAFYVIAIFVCLILIGIFLIIGTLVKRNKGKEDEK
ncbi:MAG TPA: D-alanyl-D-alanine carboxypeptidase family protein [Lachnospiraceae bacterium]|nr:D-alanyl-D-alanine carboxypeptidase family protein [Lachnospiraceae bacterium]